MLTRRINGVETMFMCQECRSIFEMDWHGAFAFDVKIHRLELCTLCNGRGKRYVRLPPYINQNANKLETCCDCRGSGFRKVIER